MLDGTKVFNALMSDGGIGGMFRRSRPASSRSQLTCRVSDGNLAPFSPVPLDLDALCAAEASAFRTLRTPARGLPPFWSTLQMPMQVELNLWVRRCTTDVPAHLDQPALGPATATAQAAGLNPPPRGGPRGAPSRPSPGPPRSHRWNDAADYAVNALLDDVRD